jgi:hypothetical protein
MRPIHLTSVLALSLAAACGSAPADIDAGPPPMPVAAVSDGDVFTQTAVWLDADGTSRVETRPITLAEERAIAARIGATPGTAQPLIQQDLGCGSSFWLYDGPNYSGNRICFNGAGTASLALYPRQVCVPFHGCSWYTWQIYSGSWYDAYTASGVLTPVPPPSGEPDANDQMYFSAYQYDPQFSGTQPLMTLVLNS